jgi:ATP-dependent DNA helicase DinG
MGFTFAVAKGRRRYVCTAKLLGAAQGAGQERLDLDGSPDDAASMRTAADQSDHGRRSILIGLAESLESGRWSGDRDALMRPVADALWDQLTTDRQGCTGKRCPHFERCPFQAARQRIRESDLVQCAAGH